VEVQVEDRLVRGGQPAADHLLVQGGQEALVSAGESAGARRRCTPRRGGAHLTRRIARNEAASKGLMTELARLGDDTSPASTAYRTRIRERFCLPPNRRRLPKTISEPV
jgi:hypothetical protein